MNHFFIIALCVFPTIFVVKSKLKRVVYLKQLLVPVSCTIFILCLIMFSDKAVRSAVNGLNMWLTIVFPSLFPFFVASELLNSTGFVKAVGILLEPIMRPLFNVPGCGSFPFAMGITSGYPVGARITAGMRNEKMLTKTEAERLLAFTNNSGPLFIIGAVAVGMFNMPSVGLFLLLCHIAACFTVGFLFRFYGEKSYKKIYSYSSVKKGHILRRFKQELFKKPSEKHLNFGAAFGNAVKDSIMTLLSIGGFIVLFSVIINLLIETGVIGAVSSLLSPLFSLLGVSRNIVTSLVSGFFEITTGTNMVSKATGATIGQKLCAASFIAGWAGLSVHSQVLSIISATDLSIKPYLLGKLLQGIISAIYTFIGTKISGELFLTAQPVFLHYQLSSWQTSFLFSTVYLVLAFFLLLTLTIISIVKIYIRKIGRL